MTVVAWIILGVVSGIMAGRIAHGLGRGFVLDVVLGVVGAIGAGALALRFCGDIVVTPLHGWTLFASMTSAVILLAAHHASIDLRMALANAKVVVLAH